MSRVQLALNVDLEELITGERSTDGAASQLLAVDCSNRANSDIRIQAACCTPAASTASTARTALAGSGGAPSPACC